MGDVIKEPSLWLPISDPVDLAHLGKLLEELGEATAIASRCVIQGMDGKDPETGAVNRDALLKELADVHAMTLLALRRFDLDAQAMVERSVKKQKQKLRWHEMIEEHFR